MSFFANAQRDGSGASASRPTKLPRTLDQLGHAGLVVAALFGIGMLAAACGGGSSGSGIASLATATTATTASSGAPPANATEAESEALRYIDCLRTHGEPNMPEPSFSARHISINISPSAGVNPNSPQFAAASKACKHLLPKGGSGVSTGTTITPADQADYLRAVVCMRSHGFPDFPDPTFQNNSVTFNTPTPIDTNSAQYKSALATCEKLIPAGLPYSSTSAS